MFKRNKSRYLLFFLVVLLGILSFNNRAFSQGENKVKSGPELVGSNPINGEIEVSLEPKIHLVFNKNVVNMAVKENNKSNISLLDSNNKEIAINIIFPDDQIEPELRREIWIEPSSSLEPGQKYIIKIGPGFMAKNGLNIVREYRVEFETQGRSSEDKEEAKSLNTDVETPEESPLKSKEETKSVKAQDETPEIPKEVSPKEVSKEELISENKPIETTSNEEIESETTIENTGEKDQPEEDLKPKITTDESKEGQESKDLGNKKQSKSLILILAGIAIAALGLFIKTRSKNEK